MKPSKFFTFFVGALLLATPLSALAAVQITEIMYDLSGTDTGREWVEITNTGSGSVDVSGYKFFEANTNHAMSVIQGGGVLQPGASAVIADDSTKFLIDWPSYTGTLFDSTFSLSNTGETIGIKDSALNLLDSVTYDSSMGAGGDGNSLKRSGSSFVAAAPTPGTFGSGSSSSGSQSSSQNTATTTVETPTTNTNTGAGNPPPPITLTLSVDDLVMVGGGSFFSATAFGTQGVPLPNPRVIWNFGDGTTAEGTKVFHAYSYPGKYAVSATAAYNYSTAMARTKVEAVAAQVNLQAEADGSLTVFNKSTHELDVGLWWLREGRARYVIPEDTLVLAGEGVRFAPAVLQFSGSSAAVLYYPNDATAARAAVAPDSPARGERVLGSEVTAPTKGVSQKIIRSASSQPQAVVQQPPPSGDVLGTSTQKPAESSHNLLWSLVGLAAVLGVGAGGVWYLRPRSVTLGETLPSADEFDIE